MSGFVVGMIRMCLDFYYGEPPCNEEDNRPFIVAKVSFLAENVPSFLTYVEYYFIVFLLFVVCRECFKFL